MKCTIPEISWHNREPVLSIDIHPQIDFFFRLATGGADCHVLIWQLIACDNGAVKVEALSDLTRHQRAVNCVRWSPTGQYLATADDDANIIIWQLKTDNIPLLEGETNDKETWTVYKVMRGHKEDIYDVSWSPSGLKLLSGSIDNTAILWDFVKGSSETIFTDHKGFVQGVCWDPKSQYFATISTDRICRIFETTSKQIKARMLKGLLPVPDDHYLHNKEVKYFHDDTFKSFFRRLDFSPDGSLLAVPSGRIEIEDCKKVLCGTYIFATEQWTVPVAVFPSGKQCSTVVRFCPILFELHEDGPDPIITLPFRMIVAVGTDHDVILYDTQQMAPFAYFRDIHYTRLTDLTWSKSGTLLIASSTDGFCALITFEPNELGVSYVKEESEAEESIMDVSGCEELEKEEPTEVYKPKKPSLLEKWAIKTPKRSRMADDVQSGNKLKNENVSEPKKEIKRIKPLVVAQSKPEEIKKVKEPPKVSPLLKFLKTTPKEKLNENKSELRGSTPVLPADDITLDENEARDAWKCDKEEKRLSNEKKIIMIEDETEDFSLHLDTSSKPCNHKNESENKTEEADINEKQNNLPESRTEQIENGGKEKTELKNEKTLENIFNAAPPEASLMKPKRRIPLITLSAPPEASLMKPKRRIPLITLSSPKHKKK